MTARAYASLPPFSKDTQVVRERARGRPEHNKARCRARAGGKTRIKHKVAHAREDYRDKSTRGLQLRVTPTGVKSFSYTFRFGSKMGRVTLGNYPDLDLKTARQKTDEFRRLVSLGIDPRSEKRDKLAKQQMTVERMVTEFINQYAKPKNTSWKQAESNLRLYLISALGRQSIHDVKRTDIHSILDELVGRGKHIAANRALAHIRKFFGWLVERGYLDHSPADHIKPRHQEQERERVLSDVEIRAIWSASGAMSGPYSAWIKLLLLFLVGDGSRPPLCTAHRSWTDAGTFQVKTQRISSCISSLCHSRLC